MRIRFGHLGLAAVAAVACTTDTSATEGPHISGLVHDALGDPIADVEVVRGDLELGRTDEAGRFVVEAGLGEEVVLQFHQRGLVRGLERVTVVDGATALQVTMVPEAPGIAFDGDAGGRVEGVRAAAIEAPPHAFVDRGGHAITGIVDVHLTPLDPAIAAELAAYPGDGRARTSAGELVQLETYGVVDVTVRQGDTDLTIADGVEVVLEIPVPDPAPAELPATVALWDFDDAEGIWTEAGLATLEAERGVYSGIITHLSPWNVDAPIESSCVTGEVLGDDGKPVVGAYVVANGLDYLGDASATTGIDGSFCVPARARSEVRVTVHLKGGAKQSRDLRTEIDPIDLAAGCDPASCVYAGTWSFAFPMEPELDADECADENDRAYFHALLQGSRMEDVTWAEGDLATKCGPLAGFVSDGRIELLFDDSAGPLSFSLGIALPGGETGLAIPALLGLYDELDSEGQWSSETCTVDVDRNELLAAGIFMIEGRGRCPTALTPLFGEGAIEIDGEFTFAAMAFADDVEAKLADTCCATVAQRP